MLSSITRHQVPKMESPNILPNSERFPLSEDGTTGERKRSTSPAPPTAAQAECESVAVIKEQALLPTVPKHDQLQLAEFEGAASEEATLLEGEMDGKMEASSNDDDTIETYVQDGETHVSYVCVSLCT